MSTVTITTPAGASDGTVELPAHLFDVTANVPLMHQVVVAQLAAARQGTHKVKTRGEVRGGGKKPYRQKGTGRARQGSTRAPQFAGGGVVHGPVPRDYSQRTPKKMKAAALRGALSDRARGGNVHVLSGLVEGDKPSTRTAVKALAAVSTARNILVVLPDHDEAGWLSLRNVPTVHLLTVGQLNTYDVLISDDVVFTKDAFAEFVHRSAPLGAGAEESAVDVSKPGRHAAPEQTATEQEAGE
ncbi:50S ribosomal protein L4 [Nakamurella flava]|jgi:large subunit ribosomal protein L4|uniref:Large ribosomal subunit protein uL4 n=1 Tax=Nakamurella flava TaxID=2576308 RepID=A0A4U6QEU8_9ACTN|nr:50S ribosomal protein L4 [Nakamurella flava]TKV58660.1 50S ribosomal protein L4 [Nakamurella flava]